MQSIGRRGVGAGMRGIGRGCNGIEVLGNGRGCNEIGVGRGACRVTHTHVDRKRCTRFGAREVMSGPRAYV